MFAKIPTWTTHKLRLAAPKLCCVQASEERLYTSWVVWVSSSLRGIEIAQHDAGVIGWLCVLFFGLGAVVFAAQFAPGACYLRIRSDGFRFCSLFRKSR
jgi:hypothetical protein